MCIVHSTLRDATTPYTKRYTQPYYDRTRINRPTKAYDHNTTDYIYYEPTLKPTQCVFIFFPPHIF